MEENCERRQSCDVSFPLNTRRAERIGLLGARRGRVNLRMNWTKKTEHTHPIPGSAT
jgi:hypothetical protein